MFKYALCAAAALTAALSMASAPSSAAAAESARPVITSAITIEPPLLPSPYPFPMPVPGPAFPEPTPFPCPHVGFVPGDWAGELPGPRWPGLPDCPVWPPVI